MNVEEISKIAPLTGLIRPTQQDDIDALNKSKNYSDQKFEAEREEERKIIAPTYNSKGKIIKKVSGRYIEIFI